MHFATWKSGALYFRFHLVTSVSGLARKRYGKSLERMSVKELEEGKQWLNDTFYLIRIESSYCVPRFPPALLLYHCATKVHVSPSSNLLAAFHPLPGPYSKIKILPNSTALEETDLKEEKMAVYKSKKLSEKDCLPNIDWILNLAKAAVLRNGVTGLVIDPYNELDHQRNAHQTETEYVSQMLTKVKRFAQHHSCHVWFVAHPRQLHYWIGSPPNLYDISGSAHFINKCDNGIVIHRNRDPEAGPMDLVQVCVRKVRNKVIGTIGDAFLSYNRYELWVIHMEIHQ
ncbi:hypothetical protein M9H77_17516 [Catharanthus roseus]|uniref:Uncharacterized protein n=1 Tax=Catharanthus roseus TaxID=4058 RepID=A0ACC0B4V9_CATRO|nr:hypothetical protein M9H77_17516 [Catharanthus roseus]